VPPSAGSICPSASSVRRAADAVTVRSLLTPPPPSSRIVTAAVNELVIPPDELAAKHVVLNENVGFELLAQNEGGWPFTWVARERVFADGSVEHFAPTSADGSKVANGGLQGL